MTNTISPPTSTHASLPASRDGAHRQDTALSSVISLIAAITTAHRVAAPTAASCWGRRSAGTRILYRDMALTRPATGATGREWAQECGDGPLQAYVLLKSWNTGTAVTGLRMLTLAQAVQNGAGTCPTGYAPKPPSGKRGHACSAVTLAYPGQARRSPSHRP